RASTDRVLVGDDGRFGMRDAPMLNALNEVLRDDFIKDSLQGIARWNKVIEKQGLVFRLPAPAKGFNPPLGTLAGLHVTPEGQIVDERTWQAGAREWLPSD